MAGFWHEADVQEPPINVRFRGYPLFMVLTYIPSIFPQEPASLPFKGLSIISTENR
jgi:hypothetical protein